MSETAKRPPGRNTRNASQHRVLVGAEVDDAVGDDDVDGRPAAYVLDRPRRKVAFSTPASARFRSAGRASPASYRGRMPVPPGATRRADSRTSSPPPSRVEDVLTRAQLGEGGSVPTAE